MLRITRATPSQRPRKTFNVRPLSWKQLVKNPIARIDEVTVCESDRSKYPQAAGHR